MLNPRTQNIAQKGEQGATALRETALERFVFSHRLLILLACVLITVFLAFSMADLKLNASFARMIPQQHEYIVNFNKHFNVLAGGKGNDLRVAVENRHGDILDARYLDTLKQINDDLVLMTGVDRAYVKSIWSPSARWAAVTEEGYDGGTIIPDDYSGTTDDIQQVRSNIERSGEVGRLVGSDFRSAMVYVPLHDKDPATGEPLDYRSLSQSLEELRAKYEEHGVTIRVIGFAQIVGDLIDGMGRIVLLFAVAIAISGLGVYWYTRSLRATVLVVTCSLIAVLWQLGILALTIGELDPYAILVPFLIFAVGMSHGAQKMNGVIAEIGMGVDSLTAAKNTFRRLFIPGFTALVCDGVGFAVLLLVDIDVIQELAINASVGVAALILTNLICIPILLSYVGVERRAAARAAKQESLPRSERAHHPASRFLGRFCEPRIASVSLLVAFVLAVTATWISKDLKIGDLGMGAPELRDDSRYNQDVAYINNSYSVSSDLFVVMMETQAGQCGAVENLLLVNQLEQQLQSLRGVLSVQSLASLTKINLVGVNEGNFKWYDISRDQSNINSILTRAPREFFNHRCDWTSVFVYLSDHRAETLDSLVQTVEQFAKQHNSPQVKFILGAGNAGIEAATNIVVEEANNQILYMVYAAVALLCYVTFRSWRAVVVAMVPLILTSLLTEALMVKLDIGIKVATLPVVALGVGIGVDYAIYILAVVVERLKAGDSFPQAYFEALQRTGKVVLLTGFTLCLAVLAWTVSPIKFQADMGIMLAFMFLFNMISALLLIPALGNYLLAGNNGVHLGIESQQRHADTQTPSIPHIKSLRW